MPDSFTEQLDRLAPTVDMPASRAQFERAVTGSRRQSLLLPAAVITLLLAGVVGLWALSREPGPEAPATAPDATADSTHPDGPIAAGAGFEVVHVAQTEVGFGIAELLTAPDQYEDWMNPGPGVPDIDFERNVALILTRSDNACPDGLTHFMVTTPEAGVPVWTPQFEELASACDDPLLSWLYVVKLDRQAIGPAATIRVPADEIYGVSEQLIEFRAQADGPTRPQPDEVVTLEPTGVIVPLPDIGLPALHNTSVGLVWVVHHADGSISVLPATIDAPAGDYPDLEMIRRFVFVADDASRFAAGSFTWDIHGRAVNGGRSADLIGYAGRVVAEQVELLFSNNPRIAGEPVPFVNLEPDFGNATDDAINNAFGDPLDLGTFLTLSSNGPTWRLLDATLVIEDGVGRICEIDNSASGDRLAGCSPDSIVLDTLVESTDPDITTWFQGRVLALQDPFRGFTHAIPMGAIASRNDASLDG